MSWLSCLEMEWQWGWLLTAGLAGISPHGLQVPEEQGAISWLLWDVGGWVQALVTAGEEKLAGCGML